MSVEEIADKADMIVSYYAYSIKEDHVEVIDLKNPDKRAVIQNEEVVESLMDEIEESIVLKYYLRNRTILEESLSA